MTNENTKVVQTIATALSLMPEDKRRFIMGYAEAVIDMRSERFTAREPTRTGERREGM
ncbi:MAG: hypothetical protein HFH26_14860 [Clostridiaceae bacterium]|nr:hypothetical protein [Clostridiaceae bacterium]